MPPRRSKRKRDNPADAAAEDGNAAANNDNVGVDAAPVAQVDTSGGATGAGSSRQSSGTEKKTKAKKKTKKDKPKTSSSSTDNLQPLAVMEVEEPTSIILKQTSLLSDLLLQIQSLSNNKVRCTAALQALVDGYVGYTTLDGVNDINEESSGGAKKGGGNKKVVGKATDFAPNLVSYAAALTGEDVDLLGAEVASSATTSVGKTSPGKKKSSKKSKTKGGGSDAVASSGGGDADIHQEGSDDAHLIMAVTQAINVLLSFLKEEKKNIESASTKDVGATKKPAAKKKKGKPEKQPEEDTSENNEAVKQAAIILISLSHPLLTALVNDRTMLETITKASRTTSSSGGSSPSRGAGSFFLPDTDDEWYTGTSSSRARSSTSPTRGGGHSPERSSGTKGSASGAEMKRIIMSHSKAVVGRALTSGVMGALWGLDTLGNMQLGMEEKLKGSENETKMDEDVKEMKLGGCNTEGSSFSVEHAILRKCLWSGLMALETSFQLTPKPKLLVTSSVSSPSGVSGLRSFSNVIPSSSGRIGGGSGGSGMDFENFLSNVMMGTSTTGGNTTSAVGHSHLTMGSETIAMWNDMLSRISSDYKVEFQQTTMEGSRNPNEEMQVENDTLAQICHSVTNSLFSDDGASKMISLVLEEYSGTMGYGSSVEPPKKARKTASTTTARGRKGGKQPKGVDTSQQNMKNYAELSALLSARNENHVTFDCHVSIRRWAVLAFGWLCNGQKRCLDVGTELLIHCEGWEMIMKVPGVPSSSSLAALVASSSDVASSSMAAAKKKKKKADSKSTKRPSFDVSTDIGTVDIEKASGIPGNLALIIFISCMIDMIYDAGATGGLSAPSSGWMDEYVNAVVGTLSSEEDEAKPKADMAEEKKKPAAKKKSGKTATTAADVSEPPRRSSRKRSNTSKKIDNDNNNAATSSRGSTNVSSPRHNSPNKKTPSVWVRPDIRDETAVLAKCLIEGHFNCLNRNFKMLQDSKRMSDSTEKSNDGMILVNDDDTFLSSSSTNSPSRRHVASKNVTRQFYPFMHRTLETLGRSAASSSFNTSPDDKNKIVSIGSAIVLGCFWRSVGAIPSSIQGPGYDGHVVVLDAKLVSLAVSHLSQCLEAVASGGNMTSSGTSTSLSSAVSPTSATESLPKSVLTAYRLNEALDISMSNVKKPATSTDATSSPGITSPSSYGGAFSIVSQDKHSSSSMSNSAEMLSLFVRALVNPSGSDSVASTATDVHHSAMSSLMQCLLEIISVCYDFSPEMHSSKGGVESSPTSSKKKSSSKKKKRKASDFTNALEQPTRSHEDTPKKTHTRCVLALDTLQTIILALAIPSQSNDNSESAKAARAVHSHLRKCLTTPMLLKFIQLGYVLETKLVHPRLAMVSREYIAVATSSTAGSTAFDSNRDGLTYTGSYSTSSKLRSMLGLSKIFEVWEQAAWVRHVQCAITFGRGGFAVTSAGQSTTFPPLPCLSNTGSRLQVFRAVADAEKEKAIGAMSRAEGTKKSTKNNINELWPLCLPAEQHALIANMIISSPGEDRSEIHFLCNLFVKSLGEYVNDLSKVSKTSSDETVTISDNVLLSLRDARLFGLALTQLTQDTQKSILSQLLSVLNKMVGLEGDNKISGSSLSHFAARVLTLCASVVDVVACPDLKTLLMAEVEKTNYCIPHLKLMELPKYNQPNTIIFRKEAYQSLFENWSNPSVPSAATISSTKMILQSAKSFESTIINSISLGMSASLSDGCHLLFSAWNAAAKLPSWTSSSWEGPGKVTALKKMSAVERMVRLREDMCEIYHVFNKQSHNQADTLLMKILQSKPSAFQPNAALFGGLGCAKEMLGYLTTEVGKMNKSSLSAGSGCCVATFAYYEALPLYISFLVSMYSRPGSNDMGSMHRLQQTSSTNTFQGGGQSVNGITFKNRFAEDSDGIDVYNTNPSRSSTTYSAGHSSSGGSIVRTNALNRLHTACSLLGAAPCYPDWLDAQCRFRNGIGSSVVINSAMEALSVLTSFGLEIWKCYFDSMLGLLGALDTADDSSMQVDGGVDKAERYSIALTLFYAQQQHPCELSDSFYTHVCTLCQVEEGIYKLLIKSITNRDQDNLEGAAFLTTTAQRIMGANHFKGDKIFAGERRANCQWETLLAEALRGTSLSISSDTVANALQKQPTAMKEADNVSARSSGNGNQQQVADALATYHHWRRVLNSVLNAMVPTSALLRFGINDGKGRNTHPQCDEYPGSISSSGTSASGPSRHHDPKYSAVSIAIQKALSFLSCVAAHSMNDDELRLISRAAADHLMHDDTSSSHMNAWVQMWSAKISCEAMVGVTRIIDNEEKASTPESSSELDASAAALIDTTLTLFSDTAEEYDETDLPIISFEDSVDIGRRSSLLSCLGLKNQRTTQIIGTREELDVMDLLVKFDSSKMSPIGGAWKSMQRDVPRLLLNLLCHGKVNRVKTFIAEILVDLMDAELDVLKEEEKSSGDTSSKSGISTTSVCSSIAASLDELSKDDVLLLVQNLSLLDTAAMDSGNDEEEKRLLSEKTAMIISYLVCECGKSSESSGYKIVLDEMLASLDKWARGASAQSHLIKLLYLLGARFGALNEIGTALVSLLKTEEKKTKKKKGNHGKEKTPEQYINTVKEFFELTASLDRLVNEQELPSDKAKNVAKARVEPSTLDRGRSDGSGVLVKLKSGEQIGRSCTFVETGEGFTEQHWYNCYTCGLLWDKGCCSLCARICHKGHDIGYSRKSSFFCDCGAEVATAIENGRTPCKCLTPVSEDVIREAYGDYEYWSGDTNELDSLEEQDYHDNPDTVFTELIARNFSSECKRSLKSLADEASKSEWRELILTLFNQCYKTAAPSRGIDFSKMFSEAAVEVQPTATGGLPDLTSRSGQSLSLQRLAQTSMVAIRAARSSALQSRAVPSSSSTTGGSIRKTKNDIHIQTMVADNRGRLYIAESSSVVFCSAIPVVNARFMDNPASSHVSRSQLNILGSGSIEFTINGMSMCDDNNRHLLLWGASKACVAIVSKNLDSFERIIELKLNLEPSEDHEYLVKCDWLPKSQFQIVAVCGTVVHVFDLKRAVNNMCNATTHYALAYEDVLIRSATLVGCLPVDDSSVVETKLALLLDTGRLYFISLVIDEEGNLEDHGESYIEIGQGVQFPTAGIRRYTGGEPASKGSASFTFGEGVYLSYLRQSNLLLYQCVSSCCIAFILDDEGSICGSFELLPHQIMADIINPTGHYGVSGPYAHFQELGVVKRGSETFHKISCVGKSTRSNQPKSLVIEYNEKSVSVKELSWPSSSSSGLGFISSYAYVGSCTFSCPYLVDGTASEGSINDATKVHERAYMTLLSSSGSLLFWGEDCSHLSSGSRTHYTPRSTSQYKAPAIGVFEKMINVSERDALVFGGEFVQSDPTLTKRKLSLNNTDYAISPSTSCTLTCRLDVSSKSVVSHEAIVAVRVLVGSMPDLIPREIIIMGSGRTIKLKRNVKRWYDFPLTDEETLMVMRNGLVTIWISSCHDTSSTPIIDSVEVYCRPRSELNYLKKAELDDKKAKDDTLPKLPTLPNSVPEKSILVPCIQSLTFLTQIMGHGKENSLSTGGRDTLSQIIRQTALDSSVELEKSGLRYQSIEFLKKAESDVEKGTFLIDEATLCGLVTSLKGLGDYLRTEFEYGDIVSTKQEATINRVIEMLLHILHSAVSIAQVRGGNYRQVITQMITDKICQVSMALEGKKVLDYCQNLKAMFGANIKLARPAKLVSELMLMEIACTDGNNFAGFNTLAEYLTHSSYEIVKACTSAISCTIGGSEVSNESGNNSSADKELPRSESGVITYQCDSCLVFPITDRRYTLGGEMDVDLCKNCYDLGIAYARTHDSQTPVIINGETLTVENKDMTCGKIWQMMSKPIAASSLEQAENAKRAGLLNMTGAANSALKSIPENQDVDMAGSSNIEEGDDIEVVKTEGFRSQVLAELLGLLTKSLAAKEGGGSSVSPPSNYLLQLILDLVLGMSCTEELKSTRGKEMALAFTKNISNLVEVCLSNDSGFSQNCSKMVVSLRTLAGLVLQKQELHCGPPLVEAVSDDDEKEGTRGHRHNKDKTDPRFICEVHGAPAVRRRCSHGIHKDRRFYVCGLEKNQRCNYFKWSDDVPESAASAKGKPDQIVRGREDANNIFVPVQNELQKIFSEQSLQEQFCTLVSNQFEKIQAVTPGSDAALLNKSASGYTLFPSVKTDLEKRQDVDDGVCLSVEKLGVELTSSLEVESEDSLFPSACADNSREAFLSSSLDLFSLIAPKRRSFNSDVSAWSSDWFSVLCEIISTSTSALLRQLAKSMLQRLCGGRQEVYMRVRDHYVFGFQFRKLLQSSQDILETALVVREQARQCGPGWREEEVMFEGLPASGLLGVEDLISEDWYSLSTEESIATVLDELLSAAGRGVAGTKTRSNTFRNFCGLASMSFFNNRKVASPNVTGEAYEMLEQIYHRSPIVSLLWLSSCLTGSNKLKVLSLTDIALEDSSLSTSAVKFHDDDIEEADLLVGGSQTLDGNHPSDPEQCLLKCFTVDDLIAFIKQFVANGRAKEVRYVSSSIAKKLALRLSTSDKNHLFSHLISGPFQQIGTLGTASNAFCDLLRGFIETFGTELDLSNISSCIVSSFMSQMSILNHYYGQNKGLWSKHETDTGGFSCNLSNCVNCHKQSPSKKASKTSNKKPDNNTTTPGSCSANFLPEQIRPYQRGPLGASTAAEVSSEFSTYNQLKFRVALSQVHVTVSDPRGRLVKSIGIYFSPRQVNDAATLKSTKYNHLWQRCGTLTLARGASEATCKLKHPVIAANLRFTYEEFYEKASNKRAPDGSFILYCPRCTRQVHNAHGVCGNCGEVAFQCRKCRHINYDRLDAFLCVECGYCTAGGFSYELTAGIALNAIAILDEDGFQRSMAMLRIANKRQTELRNSLKKKVMVALQQQRKINGDQVENLDEMVLYGPHLKRALLGGMPKSESIDDNDDEQGGGKKKSSRGSLSSAAREASSSSRARSLLSLARSLRNDGSDNLGARGDILRQALMSAGGSGPPGFDLDDSDILSALSAGGGGATSAGGDPLGRIVANIAGRSSRAAGSSGAGGGDGGGGGKSKDDKGNKLTLIEERNRLYSQMREAERECYELNRRIDAWNRLNKDCLSELSGAQAPFTSRPFAFTPSTCSSCAMQMAYQILSLLHAVYIANISQSEHTVTVDLLRFLLKESESLSPKLKDLKRRVIITLASTSEMASKMILAELKARLAAVQDVTSAEVLGRIVELDFPSVNDYIELAVETLSSMNGNY